MSGTKQMMDMDTEYIADGGHYTEVLSLIAGIKQSLWIATADIKDLHVMKGSVSVPLLGELAALVQRGVSVRLMHAKEPGPIFREEFDRYPVLFTGMERVLCPRIHFKMMIFDMKQVYLGSANLTGAGIGMKGKTTRNFEAGILTTDPSLVASAIEHFDSVWRGSHCKACGRRRYCSDPIL